ncbi:MAG: LysE family translocator [Tepidisphaeraceae bacterium]|jgi:threonine/homoserine/homoserine lactone efflux protein
MFGTRHLLVFVLTGILLNLTPGQDTMYILGRGIQQGRQAGLISALGISSCSLVHTFSAALGLSAIPAASATAFEIVKWIGAAYLFYLGAMILAKRSAISASPRHQINERSIHAGLLRFRRWAPLEMLQAGGVLLLRPEKN